MSVVVALWLPILLSAVFIFIASSLLNTVLPWHRNDFKGVDREDEFRAAVGQFNISPGDYTVPRPVFTKEGFADAKAKMERGPNLIMTVLPAPARGMGGSLIQWFIFLLVVTVATAWVTGMAYPSGADRAAVFCMALIVAFLAYAAALWQSTIWFGRSWVATARGTIDGLIYGAITAGTLAWLWPV